MIRLAKQIVAHPTTEHHLEQCDFCPQGFIHKPIQIRSGLVQRYFSRERILCALVYAQ